MDLHHTIINYKNKNGNRKKEYDALYSKYCSIILENVTYKKQIDSLEQQQTMKFNELNDRYEQQLAELKQMYQDQKNHYEEYISSLQVLNKMAKSSNNSLEQPINEILAEIDKKEKKITKLAADSSNRKRIEELAKPRQIIKKKVI